MSSGFPTLQRAFTLILNVSPGSQIGTVASGSSLSHYVTLPPPTPTGTLISVPGFTPEVNATVVFGTDHLYTDPDGSKFRVNVNCIVKTDDDIMLSFKYHGTYHLTEAMKQAFSGTAEEGKMPFGQSTMYLTFEVGSGKYKELENCTFVGNGRFVVEGGKISVESRWSVVVPSTASD